MGIQKSSDPHGVANPPAWPEIDEETLRAAEDAFNSAANSAQAQLELAESQRAHIFNGVGIWSGGAAGSASSALDKRITD